MSNFKASFMLVILAICSVYLSPYRQQDPALKETIKRFPAGKSGNYDYTSNSTEIYPGTHPCSNDYFKNTACEIFYKYQDAWMNKNLSLLEGDFHPDYIKMAYDTLKTKLSGKINILKEIELYSVELMSVLDIEGQEGDMFVLELKFKLIDYTVDEETGMFIDSPLGRRNKESRERWEKRAQTQQDHVVEYWVFYRYQGTWVLYNIHQVDSFFGDLRHASIAKLKDILAAEKAKSKHAPVDDQFFYKKVD